MAFEPVEDIGIVRQQYASLAMPWPEHFLIDANSLLAQLQGSFRVMELDFDKREHIQHRRHVRVPSAERGLEDRESAVKALPGLRIAFPVCGDRGEKVVAEGMRRMAGQFDFSVVLG